MPVRTRQLTALALVLAGCSASVAPIEVADGCPEQPVRGPAAFADAPPERLIDDFEHEGLALPELEGRNGFWVVGTDDTSDQVRATSSDRCAGRGQRSGHFVGSGFTSWGANWTALFRDSRVGVAVPYDGERYGGISFWAAVGPDMPTPYELPFGLTTMDVAWNGNICNRCMDYYRTTAQLDHAWRRVEVRFDELAQEGTGDPLVDLRRDELVGLIFWPSGDFDLWVDDARFEP